MATTQGGILSDEVGREAGAGDGRADGGVGSSNGVPDTDVKATAALPSSKPSTPPKDEPPPTQPAGSGLVPLRANSSSSNGTTIAAAQPPLISMPHPKKFSHVDINKRFLEKNSTISNSGHAAPSATINKTGTVPAKPTLQPAISHSRLVTAKLTADSQRAPSMAGWSRPPSTSSTLAASPSATTPNLRTAPGTASPASHGPPQPSGVGKIIQPQPRAAIELPPGIARKDSTGESAWGTTRATMTPANKLESVQSEFPTAAEVAQAKLSEKKQVGAPAQPSKPHVSVDADAFRGVHLGPNVHHWDEDEGDDSNFLDEVIQFEDGRQYTVQNVSDSQPALSVQTDLDSAHQPGKPTEPSDTPVSKEERFADDFDRSWPRSQAANLPSSSHVLPQPVQRSPTSSSHSLHSPQEQSRVLFNERSNRLEPYSSHKFSGPPRDPYPRKGSRFDFASSPTDSRAGRMPPPHSPNIQLLHKPGHGSRDRPYSEEDSSFRSRGFHDRPGPGPSYNGPKVRERDVPRRDRTGNATFPRTTSQGFDSNWSKEQSKTDDLTSTGPAHDQQRVSGSPESSSAVSEFTKDGRQLPPHLSWRNDLPVDRQRRPSAASSVGTSAGQQLPHPPVVSHVPVSPVISESHSPTTASVSIADTEEARRAAMHSAAERARARRQLEEAEREKERERARQKAEEIAAKLKADADKNAPVHPPEERPADVEPAAVKPIEQSEPTPFRDGTMSRPKLPQLAISGANVSSNAGTTHPTERPPKPTSENETGSWRNRAGRGRFVPTEVEGTPLSSLPEMHPHSLPVFSQDVHMSIAEDEHLEVVDFSEHGKLVGAYTEPTPTNAEQHDAAESTSRGSSTAVHRLDAQRSSHPEHDQQSQWRRKMPAFDGQEHVARHAGDGPTAFPSGQANNNHPRQELTIHAPPVQQSSPSDDNDHLPSDHSHAGFSRSLKSPVMSQYREAPMAALTDTMARIKGALDGMHKPEPKPKWVPPALRNRSEPSLQSHDPDYTGETFDVTGYEPPRSPKPAWNHFAVRLPRLSQAPRSLSPRRQRPFGSQRDVIIRAPPMGYWVETMSRRGAHSDTWLFAGYLANDRRTGHKVKLPRTTDYHASQPVEPRVSLPNGIHSPSKVSSRASVRPNHVDSGKSWRKPPASPLQQSSETTLLDTVSRSPPPEASDMPSAVQINSAGLPPAVSVPSAKAKSQPKVPDGSAVAFYRDVRAEASEARLQPKVNFIVTSELEEETSQSRPTEVVPSDPEPTELPVILSFPTLSPMPAPALPSSFGPMKSLSSPEDPVVETRKGNRSPVQAPITPPTHSLNLPSLTWSAQREAVVKDSPSRPPDREHLKAVWSTTSNRADGPQGNSLKAIADDLSTVPLPVQDAKWRDLQTAPARSSNQASRTSIMHDITRTFQQVPTSSTITNSAALRSVPLPQTSSTQSSHNVVSPPQRQPSLPQPMHPTNVRPPYAGYPSPMMSSPSPTLVYPQAMTPSPIPRPMVVNGASQYPQPVWVPMPPPNGHPGMMRPMTSPYGAQLMPYPPGSGMYPPTNMQAPAPPQTSRTGNMMYTPVTPHSQPGHHPMYGSSPVMMPAVPNMPTSGHNYPSPGMHSRAPAASRGAYDGMQQSSSFQSTSSAYSTAPNNSFARPTW